ncbi:uncharacterized protein LOC128557260 [Mercenaria mercenaria]|uniref:uncharacterized protein LOC128557260 n=1 Tax=Mercenaria mercenaria TaxID=6596 RepID=UPI00234F3B99|nr:uncharacterized protein LOC128557260 [Mercenaria mercenaria]
MNLFLSLCLGVVFSCTFAEKTQDEDTLSNILTELRNLQEAQKRYTNTLDEFKSRVSSLENTVKDLQRENKELVSEIRRLKNDKRQNIDINDDQLQTDEPVEERVPNVDDIDKLLNTTFPMLKTVKGDKKTKKHVRKIRQVADTHTAFTAGLSVGEITLGDHHTVIFDKVYTNIGNAYHAHTGIFIAPCRGLYVFSTTMMVSPGKDLLLEIVKDGSIVNYIYADARSTSAYMSTTKEWTLEVNKGSEVWIRSRSQGQLHGYLHSLFSGFLLFETE